MSDDKTHFAKRPDRRDFLNVDSRDKTGTMLFAKLGKSVTLDVFGWEWFTGEEGENQVALLLREPTGKEFIFPLGVTAQYAISDVGVDNPDALLEGRIDIETYETGSTGKFKIGKRITKIELAE